MCRGVSDARPGPPSVALELGPCFSGRHQSTFFHFQSDPDIPADTDTSPIPELCLLSCYYPKQTSSTSIGTRYRWYIGSASSLVKISVSYMNVFFPPTSTNISYHDSPVLKTDACNYRSNCPHQVSRKNFPPPMHLKFSPENPTKACTVLLGPIHSAPTQLSKLV